MAEYLSSKSDGVYVLNAGDQIGIGRDAVGLILIRGGKYYALDITDIEDQEGLQRILKDPRVTMKRIL